MATVEFLVALNAVLAEQIEYTTRDEPGVQTPEQTQRLLGCLARRARRASCTRSAWLDALSATRNSTVAIDSRPIASIRWGEQPRRLAGGVPGGTAPGPFGQLPHSERPPLGVLPHGKVKRVVRGELGDQADLQGQRGRVTCLGNDTLATWLPNASWRQLTACRRADRQRIRGDRVVASAPGAA